MSRSFVWRVTLRRLRDGGVFQTQAGTLHITGKENKIWVACSTPHREDTVVEEIRQMFTADFWRVTIITELEFAGEIEGPEPLSPMREKARMNGFNDCLEKVRASLAGYPNEGGDVVVMGQVERIVNLALGMRNYQERGHSYGITNDPGVEGGVD